MLILTPEFPPRIVGKIGEDVSALASELRKAGVSVEVITYHESVSGVETLDNGVQVRRVSNPVSPHINILTWTLNMSSEIQRAVADAVYAPASPPIDLIDVQEWHGVVAAVAAKKAFGLPIIYTTYSLEDHRSLNPEDPLSIGIKSIEWLGAYEAKIVLARSERVMSDLTAIHRVPTDKIRKIPSDDSDWVQRTLGVYGEVIGNG